MEVMINGIVQNVEQIQDLKPGDYFVLLNNNRCYKDKPMNGTIFKMHETFARAAWIFSSNMTDGMYFDGSELCLKI